MSAEFHVEAAGGEVIDDDEAFYIHYFDHLSDDTEYAKNKRLEKALTEELMRFIHDDWREEFTETVRSLLGSSVLKESDLGDFAYKLLRFAARWNAIKCAEALVKGDIGLTLDLNRPYAEGYVYPLHHVARNLSPLLTEIFLRHGAKANHRARDGSLPLDLALQELRMMVWWTGEQSVYRLLFSLCGHAMFEPLMTLRYLGSYLSITEWCDVVSRYVVEGKIIEVAALLITAPNGSPTVEFMYLPSDGHCLTKKMTLRQHVVNQIVFLTNEECKLESVCDSRLAELRKKKKLMTDLMLLLEIFYREGSLIESDETGFKCMPYTIQYVALLLLSSGFELTGEDALLVKEISDCRNSSNFKVDPKETQFEVEEKNLPLNWELEHSVDTMANGRDSVESENQKVVSLDEMLAKIRSNITAWKWTSKQSLFKLICTLCLPKMNAALEVIRQQVQNIEKIHNVACYYAMEDNLIELSILLMVARGKIMDQIQIEFEEKNSTGIMSFRQLINSELAQLIDLEYRLIGRKTKEEKKLSQVCKRRISSIQRTLPLIEIFEKAGSGIDKYHKYLQSRKNIVLNQQVAKDVAMLLLDAGFKLKSRDIEMDNEADRCSIEMNLEAVGCAIEENKNNTEMNIRSQQQDVVLPPCSPPHGFSVTHPLFQQKAPYSMPSEINRFILAKYPWESKISLSPCHPYHAFWISGARFYSGYQKVLWSGQKEVSAAAAAKQRLKFHEVVEFQQNDVVAAVEKQSQKFQGGKLISSLTSLHRVGIKYL